MNAPTSPEDSRRSATAVIRRSAVLAQAVVLDPGRHADEHHVAQAQLGLQRDMQRDAGPERVPQEVTGFVPENALHRFDDQAGGRRQVGAHATRVAVSGEVDGHHREVLLEQLAKGAPEPTRLGKAVQRHQRPPRTAYLDMEWHVG